MMAEAETEPRTVYHRSLLILLVVVWAVSWPAIKVGVAAVPPIWFGCLRYAIAASCLFVLVAARRELVLPPRFDWPLIAISGALQMGAYSALTGLALTVLPPGRASVLAFSTPIWVVPLAAWWLREYVSRLAMLGVGLGLLGIFAIAAPSLHPTGTDQAVGYILLVGAAAAWAISIVFVRSHHFTATALQLAPWQMLVAAGLLGPLSILVEGFPRSIGASGVASLAYVGPVATAFAYWAVVEAGRHLRASTISMALLATPSLGILISAATLGETVDASLVLGVVSIGTGIRLATIAFKPGTTNIRMAQENDAKALPDIERSAGERFRELPDLAWIADEEDQGVERHLELIAKGTNWVAIDGHDRPIAFLSAEVQGDALHIWEIAVRRDRQGSGIGRALLQKAIQDARMRGLLAVTLTTFRDVIWNEPFYRSLGFQTLNNEETGERLHDLLRWEIERGLPGNRRCAMRLVLR